jgi:hypothetical protein
MLPTSLSINVDQIDLMTPVRPASLNEPESPGGAFAVSYCRRTTQVLCQAGDLVPLLRRLNAN